MNEENLCFWGSKRVFASNHGTKGRKRVIYHYQGEQAKAIGDADAAEQLFDKAAQYWVRAIRMAPNNYLEAQNWLKTTGRSNIDVYF